MSRKSSCWYRTTREQWYTTIHGKQLPLGVTGPENYAAALEAVKSLLAAAGIRPAEESARPPERPSPPIVERLAAYLAHCETLGLNPETLRVRRRMLKRFGETFGSKRETELKAAEIEAAARAVGTWSDDTRRNHLAEVEHFLRWAGCPVELDKPPRGSAGAEVVVSEEVYRLAVDAATGDLKPLLVVLWHTGARPSEVARMTAEGVDWDNAVVVYKRHKTRRSTGKPRIIMLPTTALAVLRTQRVKYPAGLLFRTPLGTAYSCSSLTRAVWRLAKKIGRPLVSKGFRHTFATDALAAGIPDVHVAALLGHTSTAMVAKHYGHLDARSRVLKDAAARVRG